MILVLDLAVLRPDKITASIVAETVDDIVAKLKMFILYL